MKQYQQLVRETLTEGSYKPNRTGVDTISAFARFHRVDLSDGFPLVTTKAITPKRWNSIIKEFFWYLSGEHHIRELRRETGIWDAWADEEGNLPTAYGRFWRKFPIPQGGYEGESWLDEHSPWVSRDEHGQLVMDQIQYLRDTLRDQPHSRRLILLAWHPGNAAASHLPPCHYTAAFSVQGGKLNAHLTQRSADIALGVPFNIAHYSLLTHILAQEANLTPGEFAHTLIDSHSYCGTAERGRFYETNLPSLQQKLRKAQTPHDLQNIIEWIEQEAPTEGREYDHVPGLLTQLQREPRERPQIIIAKRPLERLTPDDIRLEGYNPHPPIKFRVAE